MGDAGTGQAIGLGYSGNNICGRKVGKGGLDGKCGGGVVMAWWMARVLPVACFDGGEGAGSCKEGNGIGY